MLHVMGWEPRVKKSRFTVADTAVAEGANRGQDLPSPGEKSLLYVVEVEGSVSVKGRPLSRSKNRKRETDAGIGLHRKPETTAGITGGAESFYKRAKNYDAGSLSKRGKKNGLMSP